eukprot:TRINITY_DN4192_c0_g1_i4.p1 TRINITY_DN4192_c0_g1~~TRINITY_DN4192_c0_g1_i4.p1  ORF type:complete len:243 (+),score=46.27 TRINITY_DN4192_c0_g1_i4:49-777(+)
MCIRDSVIAMKKFVIADGWVPKKLDVFIDAPAELDVGFLKATGKQDNEEELPQEEAPAVEFDQTAITQLTGMGFSVDRAKRALFNTGNAGADAAMNWIFAHMDDPGIDDPFVPPKPDANKGGAALNENSVAMLTGMGFSRAQAARALKATDGDVARATNWIFSHADDMDTDDGAAPAPKVHDGGSKYKLIGFVSHIGGSTQSGHYVCHLLKDGKWVLFNDRKVLESANPPTKMGYLYFYQRT